MKKIISIVVLTCLAVSTNAFAQRDTDNTPALNQMNEATQDIASELVSSDRPVPEQQELPKPECYKLANPKKSYERASVLLSYTTLKDSPEEETRKGYSIMEISFYLQEHALYSMRDKFLGIGKDPIRPPFMLKDDLEFCFHYFDMAKRDFVALKLEWDYQSQSYYLTLGYINYECNNKCPDLSRPFTKLQLTEMDKEECQEFINRTRAMH
jgi:hypothetical protein